MNQWTGAGLWTTRSPERGNWCSAAHVLTQTDRGSAYAERPR